jgi:hypothetical protein
MAKKEIKGPQQDFAFGKENYVIMLIGIAVIFVGFLCMTGGSSPDPAGFNPEMFSFRRITLAPILVILGFVIEVYAIVKKSKE